AVTFSNTGVTASAITLTDATHLTATLTIAAGAATGASNVTVTTGSEIATGSSLFTVTAGTPVVLSLSTASGQQGQVLSNVVITGQFTHLTATRRPAACALSASRNLTRSTGSEIATGSGKFTVTAGTPVVLSLSTASG